MNQVNQVHNVQYKIVGMDCPGCARTIETVLKKLKGVHAVDVQFASEKLSLAYSPDQIFPAEIEKRVLQRPSSSPVKRERGRTQLRR
ncbi:MAG: heavy-metal-associated domain-containing protein [Candidatus Poribacteria bacterium]|nr:heavy-metal-associated domain-containing protein [Candidatus Poribacteria bacterium]